MGTERTSEEKEDKNFNYYLVFGINPIEKNKEEIDKKINFAYNPATSKFPRGHRMLELKNDAIKVMNDPSLRNEEFEKAKKIKLSDVYKTIVNIANARGVIYKSDFITVATVANKSGNWLTVDDIEKECKDLTKQGIKIIDNTTSVLDFGNYQKIENDLEKALKTDLYSLIGKSRNTSIDALSDAIKKVNSDLKGKTDPISAAISRLCGLAKIIFKDDNSKKYYDIYLDTKDIWNEFDERKRFGILDMSLHEFLTYIDRTKKALNISDNDYIETILAARLSFLKITVEGGKERRKDLEECAYCGKAYANNDNPKTCPYCHNPLEIVCWNCGGMAPYTVKKNVCPSCGAAKEHRARFETIVKKMDKLLVQPEVSITDIQSELNDLKNILPDYKKVSASKLAKKVTEYQDKIDKKIKEEETIGKAYKDEYEKIQELVNLKKYISASGDVTKLKNKYPKYNASETDTLSAHISSVVSRVKQHADKAKSFVAQNKEDDAVNEIAAALGLSTDYIEANQILSKFPPGAPSSVDAKLKENAALITWVQNKPQKLVTCTVIRKNGSRPTSISDGIVVASELSINFFEDKTIVSDTPYYYAVFSSRLGINSSIVCTSAPVVTYFEVSNIRQDVVSGKIVVKWELPLNVGEVEVIRKKGLVPPIGREDGQKIPVKGNESFEDGDYDRAGNSYLFICVYKNDKGVTRSKGVTRTFKVFEELKPLSNVKIEQNGADSFTLSCDKVASGKRGIYYSTQEIGCKFGSTLHVAEFKNFYKNLNEASLLVSDGNTATFHLPPDKAYYVYPVVCNEQLLIVSKPIIVNTMIGVSQVSYSETSGEVVITGRPHLSAKTIIAKVSNTAFPTALDSDGDRISVTKDEFASKGLRIKLKMNADSYIAVFVETEKDGIKSVTCGVCLSEPIKIRSKVTVWYAIKFTASAVKPFPIKIDFQSDVSETIPEMMLVKGSPKPLNKNDGQLVDRTPILTLKKGLLSGGKYNASVTIKSPPVAMNTKFALFQVAENKNFTFKELKSL